MSLYLGLWMRPLHNLDTWKGGLALVSTIAVAVAAFLGLGTLGVVVVVLAVLLLFSIAAGVCLIPGSPSLEIEPLAATKQPLEIQGFEGHDVYLVQFLVRNEGPTSEFVAQVVSKSVRGIGEEYPQGSFSLRWQVPNRDERQRIARGMDARVDVAWVLPAAGVVRFLGPELLWKEVGVEDEELVGLIDLADVERDTQPKHVRFRIVTGPSNPVALEMDPG